jgi:sterol desaturase/sphingolipid hydroxylase (fatty acid hydroxylase superfamily)
VSIATGILNAGLSFLVLFLILRPLELAYPARRGQRFFRPQWLTDLCFLVGQYLFFNGAVLWLLGRAQPWLRAATPRSVFEAVAGLNSWLQALLVILLGDFLIYWGHRLQHRVGFLWRFHSIHHSAEHLDWLAAHREHPVDSIYTIFLVNLPIFALGFPIEFLAWFAGFRGLWAVFIHSNVRLPIGPLRFLIGAPELHHWHHDREREAGNYANVSPVMDLLFGTYRCPDHEPASVGVQEPMPKGYLGLLAYPFRRRGPRVTTTSDSLSANDPHPTVLPAPASVPGLVTSLRSL